MLIWDSGDWRALLTHRLMFMVKTNCMQILNFLHFLYNLLFDALHILNSCNVYIFIYIPVSFTCFLACLLQQFIKSIFIPKIAI